MFLAWVELRDFRCHRALEFRPDPGVNLLLGGNGAGKTSVLEGIGFLATLRSFRGAPDAALVRVGADPAVVRGDFGGAAGATRVETEIPAQGRQRVLVDGKRAGRAEVAQRVALVAFLPDDLDLMKRGPALRRDYADELAVQLWPVAAVEQRDYERALTQRNALLRREGRTTPAASLSLWDERLTALGATVVGRRLAALAAVAGPTAELCRELGAGEERVAWSYWAAGVGEIAADAGPDVIRSALTGAFAEARPADLDRRTTTIGPHRDEIIFTLDGRDLRTRASQGEQRTVALALRVGSFELLAERRRSAPLLLLDDVFSELDATRRERLVARLPAGQVLISSAHREDVPVSGRCWEVAPGSIREVPA